MNEIFNIKQLRSYNYIAVVVTNWHLIGAKAACAYLKDNGVDVHPIYINVGHPSQGFLKLDYNGDEHCTVDINKNFSILKILKLFLYCIVKPNHNKTQLYIGMPWHISVKTLSVFVRNKYFKCLIYEEGAKSYNPRYSNIHYLWNKYNVMQFLNQLSGILFQRCLNSRNQIIDLHPLTYLNGKLCENPLAVSYYKKVLDITSIDLDNNVILFVMQSLEEEYIRILNIIIPQLINRHFKVVIKEHPRFPLPTGIIEGAELIKDNRSLEKLMPIIKAKYIVGFFSTALVTTHLFFNCTPISLYKLMRCSNIKSNVNSMLSWFENSFCDIVKYPNSIDALFAILNEDKRYENRNCNCEL